MVFGLVFEVPKKLSKGVCKQMFDVSNCLVLL